MLEQMVRFKNGLLAGFSAALSAGLRLLGGWDGTLQVLVGAMAADILTGLLLAGFFCRSPKTEGGALESRAGFRGLLRKVGILLAVFLAALLDGACKSDFVRPAVCVFFAANEGLSILENLGLMGVPYPAFLKNMLEALKEQGDRGGKGDA